MDRREARSAASRTRDLADEKLTETVLASFDGSRSPRFKEIMQSLIRHLHAFVSEVGLTEEEWFRAIDFLTRTGVKCEARTNRIAARPEAPRRLFVHECNRGRVRQLRTRECPR